MDSSEAISVDNYGSDREADCINLGEENGEEVEKNDEEVDENQAGQIGSKVLDTNIASLDLLGLVVNSEELAYKLYCEHGYRRGFSVRKGKQYKYSGTNKIKTKYYFCSKQGERDQPDLNAAYNRKQTRVSCKARIKFAVDEEGKWTVAEFYDEHTHEMARPEDRHLLRHVWKMTKAKAALLGTMLDSGFETIQAISFMTNEVGGEQNLRFTKKDDYNYVNKQRLALIEAGDCASLVGHFKCLANKDGMFHWDFQVNEEGQMTNFYWRDGRCRIDYDCFGDVVIFDTTYRTNKYNLICAPFVGVNHHWQNLMFGCAFLSDETTVSFEWLFNAFLDSMGGRAPKTIFTDQNQEMEKVIQKVFPDTRHRLCLWNISQKVSLYLGDLKSNRDFNSLFYKCLQGCDSEEEFEETWRKMMSDYELEGHKWLCSLYNIRQKWCTGLNKDAFDAGMRSSQQSESTSNVLNGIADKSTCLTKFVIQFDKKLIEWRRNEVNEDFRCFQSDPPRASKHNVILKQVAKVYTHKIYKMFESELIDGIGGVYYNCIPCGGTVFRYNFRMQGQDSTEWVVHIDTSTMEVQCSCNKFQTVGILCRHALAAYNLNNASYLPEKYILKRWTKDARRVHTHMESESSTCDSNESALVFHNRAMRFAYDLVTISQDDVEVRKIVWDALDGAERVVRDFLKKRSMDAHSMVKGKEPNNEDEAISPGLDPPCVKPKRVSIARTQGHYDKLKRKRNPSDGELRNESSTKSFVWPESWCWANV